MDFIDWRKSPEIIKVGSEAVSSDVSRRRDRRYRDHIEELIHEAQERGDFDNLPGTGKPLYLDDDPYARDKKLAYHVLKNNGFAPIEVELAKEIRSQRERADAKLTKLIQRSKTLRTRRVPPFPSEKRAFNTAVENAAAEYERVLRELNRKILDLNLITPAPMHMRFLEVEQLVQHFRDACPLFEEAHR